jgi:cyclic pyranopterin phosphate synthase
MSEKMQFLPKKDLLTLEELDKVCSVFIDMGIRKIRVTGGEPLVRRNILSFFQAISRHLISGKLSELTLTTNGSQLTKFAQPLVDLGMQRVNISLDTLDSEKFKRITRWGRLDQVLKGIKAAKSAGLRIKINTVALKKTNEEELHKFVQWCGDEGFDLTFIEVMPMGDFGPEDRLDQYWSLKDLKSELTKKWSLEDLDI